MPRFLSGFPVCIREESLVEGWALPVLGEIALEKLKCRREVAHGMWRMRLLWAGCLEVPDLLVNGEMSLLWLWCMLGFTQRRVQSNQTSSHFPWSFSLCLLNSERRLLLLECCLPLLLSFPVYSLCTEWTGGAETETWTEEQKLNVASERINNQD